MPIVLFRVDERLIHGQVVVGWGAHLRPERYLVVDAGLARSQWEQELYVLGVPEGVNVEFLDPATAGERLEEWRESDIRSVLLTRNLETVLALSKGGALAGTTLNLGGLHLREGREEVLSYLFLAPSERAMLRLLAEEGVDISAQDLPGSPRASLAALLG